MKTILLLFLLYIIIPQHTFARDEYTLSNISYPQGLSSSAVISIYQDNEGFMWFGTYDGLNHFDGKNMYVYRTDSKQGLLNNSIYSVNGADDGCVWISTTVGINRYSIKERRITGSYKNFETEFRLCSNRQGNTWVIDKQKIYYFNTLLQSFEQVHGKDNITFAGNLSFVDESGNLWLFSPTDNTVYKYRIDNFNVENPSFSSIRTNIHQKRIIYTFFQRGNLNFIDEDNNLFLFDLERNTKIYIRNVAELTRKYGTIIGIVSFFEDIIIAFVQNGLVKLEAASHYNETIIDRSLRIFSVYRDPVQDIIWFGTDGQGVMTYSKKHSLATHIMLRDLQPKLTRQVRSIYTDKNGDLWFGTKGDGLIRIQNYATFQPEQKSQEVHVYLPGLKQNIAQYNRDLNEFQIFRIIPSQYMNGFWLATADKPGLFYYSYNKDEVIPVTGNTESLKRIHQVYEENDSTLWAATAGGGLCKAVIKTTGNNIEVLHVRQSLFKTNGKEINDFFPMVNQGDSILWLGSRGMGLVRFNTRTWEYKVYEISNKEKPALNDILSIHKKEDFFYLGTSAGLVKLSFDKKGNPITFCIDRQNGLLNDMIHGILEDDNGYLWLSTNKGLVKYSPTNNACHAFYYTNGLQIGEFSDDAYYQCPYTDNLFFGGVNGLLYLEQERMNEMEYFPEVRFRDLVLGMETVNFYDYYNEKNNRLSLKGKSVTFSLSFIAPDYIEGNNFEYSHCLEKKGKGEWSAFSSDNNPIFQSITPGEYILKVRYKKDVFDKEYKTYALNISILPPWYLSFWAIVIYILTAVVIAIYLIRLGKKYYSRERLIKELMKHENSNTTPGNTSAQFHDSSNSFATIYRMCGQLYRFKDMPSEYYKMLDIIHEKTIAFAFNNGGMANNLPPIENLLVEFPVYGEINPEETSTHIIRLLIQRGFNDLSDNDINIDDTPVYLSQTGLQYILYHIYSEAMNHKTRFPLQLKGRKIDSKFNLELVLPSQVAQRLVQNLTGSNDDVSRYNNDFNNTLFFLLCRNAIKKMKGTIAFTDTGLNIELPIHLPKEQPLATNENKKTILLLEDKDEMRWLIGDILGNDYTIIHVQTTQAAFNYLSKNTPDVFLADTQIYLEGEHKFIQYVQTNKGLLLKTAFIPMITWKAALVTKNDFHQLIDGFVIMPYNILFIKEILYMAIERGSQKTKIITDTAGEMDNGFICKTPEQAGFANELIRLFENNLSNEEFGVPYISNQMSISPRQFYRRFKEISDLSPSDFIKNYRLEKAARLLQTTDWTIQKVMTEVGFLSRSYFHREFTARFGTTPKSHQRQSPAEEEV
ncbi:two-component regulator propeller domain-containing protein [Bacteroides sp. 519]|uniref:two-component regulator propeller domain-containing protein n=1 Tax=Bacteroides sp. 519 TaxID=2302937 RepID=UPI0013D6D70A|nr:two-component regulator propeller domain-containing protein [Bacteroides sp. 519]NDV59610.1 helix-turn-helix domain-containing protein [Bacteroides sp. 519]